MIVQLLLDHGADANAQGGSALLNRSAGLAPACNPHPRIVYTLRNRKAYSIRGESHGTYGPPLDLLM
jgi:hypothetical protein